jgi:hypothetical protein
MPTPKVNDRAWDDRKLGADEEHVIRADPTHEAALDAALEMQSISIRLPKQLIRQYKMIAAASAFVPSASKTSLSAPGTKRTITSRISGW